MASDDMSTATMLVRLIDVLECEQGRRAPTGWRWSQLASWHRHDESHARRPTAAVWRHTDSRGVVWEWRTATKQRGSAPTALAAIEAAEAALAAS